MLPPHLDAKYPKLRDDGGVKTSEPTNRYNCLAWSAERAQERWYEPKPQFPWEHWPKGVPDDYSLESFILLFEKLGYKRCPNMDSSFRFFYKKVAIYAAFGIYDKDQWEFTHVSDQLDSGAWTSKLGKDEDIQHNTPHSLEGDSGDEYGRIHQILIKRCSLGQLLARTITKIGSFL